jgi:hypothetical protein
MAVPEPRTGCRHAEDAGNGRVRPCFLVAGHQGDHKPRWFEPAREVVEGDIVYTPADPGDRRHAETTRSSG